MVNKNIEIKEHMGSKFRKGNFLKNILIAMSIGAILGAIEVWFYKFDFLHLLGAIISGAVFMIFLTLMLKSTKNRLFEYICAIVAGGFAGLIWYIIVMPSSFFMPIIIGSILGMLFAWGG